MISNAHVIVGGFPIGSSAGHDMDYARLRILEMLYRQGVQSTVSNDFSQIDERLANVQLLITYVAGPYPDNEQSAAIESWVNEGGKWFALHGTSGGRAKRIDSEGRRRQMVRLAHHDLLGAFFLNHPPVRQFRIKVEAPTHPLLKDVPPEIELQDELYLIEPIGVDRILMTTELAEDPSPSGFGFYYEQDTSLQPDGKTRVLGTEREIGSGSICYIALGHTHSPTNNAQPFVDASVSTDGTTPRTFRGAWENDSFNQILENVCQWASA